MLFNSLAYLVFLPIVVVLYWLTPFKYRTPLLLVASYVFYMFWKPIYGLLMIALTAANFWLGLWLEKAGDRKKMVLALSIILNLVVLAFFKYAYFLHDFVNDISAFLHLPTLPAIPFNILLPLGISFFVFEFIHYLVDIYRGSAAIRSFTQFALFPSFFPTQIAGPIKRYQDFIPQLLTPRTLNAAEFNEGLELFLFGLFKKVCLGDNLAPLVGRCYAHPDVLSGGDLWLASWAFAFQVYFDFSGYTDIARGSAKLMGFNVPLNFNLPYLSTSMTDVWHRWHMSLSTWLRDYLFIPLGGSRHGTVMTYRNLFITMTLCGLWHGAAMHYVAFGALMGLFLIVHRLWKSFCESVPALTKFGTTKLAEILSIAITFNAWTVGMVFFRAEDMKTVWTILQKMFFLDAQPMWQPTMLTTNGSIVFTILPIMLIVFYLAQFMVSRLNASPLKQVPGIMPDFPRHPLFKPAYLAAIILTLLACCPDSTPSFVYFQF